MFRYRVLSVFLLAPPTIALLFLGGGWFWSLAAVAMVVANIEYAPIVRQGSHVNTALAAGFGLSALLAARYQAIEWLWPLATAFVLAELTWALIRFERGSQTAVADWAFTLAGGLYLGVTGAHFILLREMTVPPRLEVGLGLTLLALLGSWAVDVSSYMIGRLWGRHKLAPLLSPNKSWEGYIAGLLGGMLFGAAWPALSAALRLASLPGMTAWHSLAVCTLIAILTPLGDLGASMLKRWGKVKNSSSLIPGHGGILDRLDTLLWAAVIVYYYIQWAI
ncbi:MAG: phosphatidate cytidylyltransferase [Thermoflexales bacterium]|nr:phosphatidate cytidylyltransferase [Thermoflexales bacterium]